MNNQGFARFVSLYRWGAPLVNPARRMMVDLHTYFSFVSMDCRVESCLHSLTDTRLGSGAS